ncbi:MAG: MMPL family transporter, partial [Pseudomonadota bacterium]|nr:MMPL family transporter [Pseudomonadota bacterium]
MTRHTQSMIERYMQGIIRWRWWVVVLTLVWVVLAASGGRWLQFSTDYRVFFSQENPQLNAFEALQNIYTKNDNLMLVLAPQNQQVFTQDTLAAVVWLTEQAWQMPYSIRVDSLSNFQYTHAEGDELIVEDLVTEVEQLSANEINTIKQIALQEPLLINRIVSPQAHVTGVNVTIQLPEQNVATAVPQIVDFARDLAQEVQQRYPQLTVYLTGVVAMNNAFPEATKQDMKTLVPLMYVVILVLLGVFLRSVTGVLVTFLVISFSIMATMGFTGWLGIVLSPPSAPAPTIILTLAVADSVHILVSLIQAMRFRGYTQQQALIESVRINMQPIFLTSLTTVIGFLSMNFGDAPPFRDLGNIVAIGITFAFILSITFLPAMLAILPLRVPPQSAEQLHPLDRFANWVIHRRRGLLGYLTLLIIILFALIPRNELNDIFVEYFDQSFAFRQATDFATENLTGLYYIDYSLGSGEAGGVSEPAFLQRVDAFAQWYRQQPEVIHVNTLTDTFKRLNKNMHGDDPSYYHLPQTRPLAAQYLLLYEMSLPYGLDLNNQINIDKSATRVSVAVETLSTNALLALEQRAQNWLATHGLESMQVVGASPAIMFAHIGYRNIRGMLLGAFIALILISLILIVALRSLKYGLLSLIPNLVPAGIAFGLWGLFVGEVGLSLSIVAGMTLGIVVDDTIHFLSKYLRARREQHLSASDAVRYA